ncbi:MAG TPA: antibiotic biosynthesis monooxygenase [Bacteroidota bacterium]|nr:antibiotic biosynthesis monooxygenase [Bacteroidota bacterium]
MTTEQAARQNDPIARVWHGTVPTTKANAYANYIRSTGLTDYRGTPGNRGAFLLQRQEGDVTHFLTISIWDSIEAIKQFAGDDYEKARYYGNDKEYLLEFEPHVLHYTVVAVEE